MAGRKTRAPKQKQLPVALTPHIRRELEAAAARSGNSLGEEVRRRLLRSFSDDTIDPITRDLARAVIGFTNDVQLETGRSWHEHPASNWALRNAITARLARLKPEGEAVFMPNELPANRLLTSSDDPDTIGLTIEAFDFRTQRDTKKADAAHEKVREELLEKYPELRKDHEL
jgi:hypothetical protein